MGVLQRVGLFDQFLKELAIRRARKALRECERLIKLANDQANAAYWLRLSQERRHAELRAELVALESPDDVVRRSVQA